MSEKISYNLPGPAGAVTALTVTTTEADALVITDYKFPEKSQLTVYYKVTLGSATSVKFRYYFSPDGTTWYRAPIKNESTGLLADIPTVVDATSPTTSGAIQTMEDLGLSGCLAFKITAQSVAASATLNVLSAFVRDN